MVVNPSMRDRLRPAELLGLSAGFALFVGLIVLLTTREGVLTLVTFGVAFIVSVIVISMLTLAVKPGADERHDLDEQDRADR